MALSKIALAVLHKKSFLNREDIKLHKKISCFFCLRQFKREEIEEWIDNNLTAICPNCNIDACLPGDYETATLAELKERYFTGKTK